MHTNVNLSTSYSVSQAKSDLEAVLHGSTLNQVTGVDNIFNRAARQLLLDCDPQETIRIAQTPKIYQNVYDYPLTNLTDLKGNKIIDIRPQVNRSLADVFGQKYSQEFDVSKQYASAPNFTIDFNTAQKSLRIDATNLVAPVTLNNIDAPSSNGTWADGGSSGVGNFSQNTSNPASAPSSLQFDLTNTSHAIIVNSTSQAVDLSTHKSVSSLFLWVYIPVTTPAVTEIDLYWGSSSANYWVQSASAPYNNSSFVAGWNLVQFDWSSASSIGTPNASSVGYLRIDLFFASPITQPGFGLNTLTSNLGAIFQILYYSKFLFRDASTEAFQETVTDDSNLINLDTDTFNVFFNLLTLFTVQQISGGDSKDDIGFYTQQYKDSLARYQALYKSQLQKPSITYYNTPKPSYQKFFGSRWP